MHLVSRIVPDTTSFDLVPRAAFALARCTGHVSRVTRHASRARQNATTSTRSTPEDGAERQGLFTFESFSKMLRRHNPYM